MTRALVLITILVASAHAAAADDSHAYAVISLGPKAVFYVDMKSIVHESADISTFWLLDVEDNTKGKIDYDMLQYRLSCSTKQLADLYMASYVADGTAVNTGAINGPFEPIVPGSIGETAMQYICSGTDPFPDLPAITDTSEAIQRGHNAIRVFNTPPARPHTSPKRSNPAN